MPFPNPYGQPRKIESPEAMAEIVQQYIRSITRYVDKTEVKPVKWDKKGKPVEYAEVPIYAEDGSPVKVLEWLDMPTLPGLCLLLGITDNTFRNYAKRPEYKEICELVMTILKSYWEQQAGQIGNTRGAQFILACNFGYTDDAQVRMLQEERAKKTETPATLSEMVNFLTSGEGRQIVQALTVGQVQNDESAEGVCAPSDPTPGG